MGCRKAEACVLDLIVLKADTVTCERESCMLSAKTPGTLRRYLGASEYHFPLQAASLLVELQDEGHARCAFPPDISLGSIAQT
jgi:hypothetical protein